MNNYDFCAEWAAKQGGAVLDFGCGAGQVVGALRSKGIEAFGCDTFFEGGDFSAKVPAELAGVVKRMNGNVIPFPDASFDAVINNMVMEHVPDIDAALREIARVLKPGGHVLSLFPHQGLWFEGHTKVPLVHRVPHALRVAYLYAMNLLGFGARKGRERMAWCHFTSEYMDKWIHYRTKRQIREAYAARFADLQHIEAEWLVARLPRARALPPILRTHLARKFATLVFVCEKH